MNDPAASGRGIQQGFLFKSRSQRDAGPEWKILFESAYVISTKRFFQLPLRLVATGYETHWWEINKAVLNFSGQVMDILTTVQLD
ncbi:MAG: hypothetical protein IID17_09085 [Nitrospinae bacterium]|nr:hypothetical protein [Nitrospinota bacterium]